MLSASAPLVRLTPKGRAFRSTSSWDSLSEPRSEPFMEGCWIEVHAVVRGKLQSPARDPIRPAGVSLVAWSAWWLILLAVYVLDQTVGYDPNSDLAEFVWTALYFLPFVAIICALVALRRMRASPSLIAVARSPVPQHGSGSCSASPLSSCPCTPGVSAFEAPGAPCQVPGGP